jgi:2-amino-4-hydroxy-6-hydroxymethyldihydropteridine diphosphokinase
MAAPVRSWIGLGANLGDARATLDAAFDALAVLPGCRLAVRSQLYRSAPVDASGPDFVNAIAGLDTTLPALQLLAQLQAIEQRHGRVRSTRNAPRTLDLDLLLYGDAVVDVPGLTLPHPRAHERAFVLRPLADVAPRLVIPGRGAVRELLQGVADQAVERLRR